MEDKKLTGYPSVDKPWLKYYDKEFIAKPVPKMNIYSYLRAKTAAYQDRTAISYFGAGLYRRQLGFGFLDSILQIPKIL